MVRVAGKEEAGGRRDCVNWSYGMADWMGNEVISLTCLVVLTIPADFILFY